MTVSASVGMTRGCSFAISKHELNAVSFVVAYVFHEVSPLPNNLIRQMQVILAFTSGQGAANKNLPLRPQSARFLVKFTV